MEYDTESPAELPSNEQSENPMEQPPEANTPPTDNLPGDHEKTECLRLHREWFERRQQLDPYRFPRDIPTLEVLEAKLEELQNNPSGKSLLDIALEAQRTSICDPTSGAAQLARDKEDF